MMFAVLIGERLVAIFGEFFLLSQLTTKTLLDGSILLRGSSNSKETEKVTAADNANKSIIRSL